MQVFVYITWQANYGICDCNQHADDISNPQAQTHPNFVACSTSDQKNPPRPVAETWRCISLGVLVRSPTKSSLFPQGQPGTRGLTTFFCGGNSNLENGDGFCFWVMAPKLIKEARVRNQRYFSY